MIRTPAVFGALAAAATANALQTLFFNMTLSPMDAVLQFKFTEEWEPVFRDIPPESWQWGMVGTGPMRMYSNSSKHSYDREHITRLEFNYAGSEFYLRGWWDEWNTTGTKPISVQWENNTFTLQNTIEGSPTLQPGPDGLSLLADWFVFPQDAWYGPINSLGNASLHAAAANDKSRVTSHRVTLRPETAGNLTISDVTVMCMMQSNASSLDEVPKITVPFVLGDRPNPAFNISSNWEVQNRIGGVGGQDYREHMFLNRTARLGESTITIPVPPNTAFMYLKGTRFWQSGEMRFYWTPEPPYPPARTPLLNRIDTNSTWVYPGSIMYMETLDPSKVYSLKIHTLYQVALDSVTFYGDSIGAMATGGSASSPSRKLSAGAVFGIAIGAVVGVALLAGLAFWAGRRHFKRALARRTSRFVDQHTGNGPWWMSVQTGVTGVTMPPPYEIK
ncbi:hypothetical protein Q8F55_007337 [Vanrija albida]|uniref:Uncharacterized protein n=1 Tax=Vanrija albida TaxID=181172 RepID=A0ABR3PZN4_9TREE